METLVLIGLLGGLITGISPCILPMLPVIFFAGGVQGAREPAARSWRPYLVIAGLVLSFSAMTLLGSLVLGALGLPQDLLRWVGIVLLAALYGLIPFIENYQPGQRYAGTGGLYNPLLSSHIFGFFLVYWISWCLFCKAVSR